MLSPATKQTNQLQLDLDHKSLARFGLVKSAALTSTPLIASIIWIVALVIDPARFEPVSVLLIGLGLLAMSTVAVVGMALSGGRWARRLAFAVIVANVIVAITRSIDPAWFVATSFTALSLAAMFLPSVTDHLRKLPSASGPAPRSVLTPVVLLAVPFLVGLTSVDGKPWAMIVVGISALASSFLYARVIPGGLLAVRIIWPALAMAMAPFLGMVGGAVSALLGVGLAVLAWHPSVKVAFYPPTESGSTYAIPPELAPQDILDAAQIDDHGKPR